MCIFCDIINKKTQAEFIYENDSMFAFRDIHPKAPIHILIVSRVHIASINDLNESHSSVITAMVLSAQTVAENLGVKESGYKLAFNVGRGGGQVIDHIHMHLLAWPGSVCDVATAEKIEKEVALI